MKRFATIALLTVLLIAAVCPGYRAEPIDLSSVGQITEAETPEAEETPKPDPTPDPDPDPTPAPTPETNVFIDYPASIGETIYMGQTASVYVTTSNLIAGIILDYYGLGNGYFSNIAGHVDKNIETILAGGELPNALRPYKAAIEAAVSDINDGIELDVLKKQYNSKKAKRVTAITKGLPQTMKYVDSEELGYYFELTDLKTSSSVGKGTYYLAAEASSKTASALWALYDDPESITLRLPIKLKKQSGGGGGGGGSTTTKALPKARLIVEGVRTEPELPAAGDTFDVILTLRNTSEDLFLRNLQLTYTSDEDAVEPADGTNTIFIDRIDADSVYEQRFSVKARPDIEASAIKLNINVEFEDKKMNELTATQALSMNIRQIQRIQLDEPTLPTSDPIIGDTYDVKMGVFNLGKTVLYNVTVKAVPKDVERVSPGQAYFIGNMEPGTSKTVEMELVPLESGSHDVTLEATYETVDGSQSTASRDIVFNATEEEDYSYYEDDTGVDIDIPLEPEQPTAMAVMQALPWWIYAGFAGVLAALLLIGGLGARRRRMRAMEDDEMD